MSEESTTPDLAELVRGFWASAERGDWDAILSHFAPDAVWDFSPLGLGTFENHAAMRGLWQEWVDAYEELELDVKQAQDLGSGVAFAVVRQNARPVGSAGHVESRQALVYVWRRSLVERVTTYTDIHEARAAAERLAEERGQAMSQDNVEKVRTSLAEWDGMVLRPEDKPFESTIFSDTIFSGATGLLDPDGVYESSVLPDQAGETYRGADAWARAAETWLEPCEWMVVDLEQVLDAPEDRVVSLHRVHMKMRQTSLEFEMALAYVYTFKDGTVVHTRAFGDHGQALKAVGLEGRR